MSLQSILDIGGSGMLGVPVVRHLLPFTLPDFVHRFDNGLPA